MPSHALKSRRMLQIRKDFADKRENHPFKFSSAGNFKLRAESALRACTRSEASPLICTPAGFPGILIEDALLPKAAQVPSTLVEVPAMHIPLIFPAVASVVGLVVILAWRVQEGRRPVTLRKLLAPPLGMATGFSMFIVPMFRIPLSWAIAAFLVGAVLLAWPLLRTSRLERVGDVIWMKRSGAFFTVVVFLAAIRYLARTYFDSLLTLEQTGGLFFILAFGMILRWRLTLYFQYRALTGPSQPDLWPGNTAVTEQEQDLPA